MVDTIPVHRHTVEGIVHLLEHELGQPRDKARNYKDLNAGNKLDEAINSYTGPKAPVHPSDKEEAAEKESRAKQDAEGKKEDLWMTTTSNIYSIVVNFSITRMFLFNLIHSFDTKVFASVVHRDTFPVSINFSSYAVNNTFNSGYSGFFIIYSALA